MYYLWIVLHRGGTHAPVLRVTIILLLALTPTSSGVTSMLSVYTQKSESKYRIFVIFKIQTCSNFKYLS